MTEQKRRKRSQGGALDVKEVIRTLEACSYGGTKRRRRANQTELPASPQGDGVKGIKLRFDRATDKYPGTVEILMTDGRWVKYRIDVELPGFTAADPDKENWETGYPPKGA